MHIYACVLGHFSRVWLCNPVDCNPPGSSVHGILQARTLEWVAISHSRGPFWPRDRTCISYVPFVGRQVYSLSVVPPGKRKWFTQSCPTLCDPMDYTVHGILQTRILEWVAFPFSRGSSQPRDWTQVSSIAGIFFTSWDNSEAQKYWSG